MPYAASPSRWFDSSACGRHGCRPYLWCTMSKSARIGHVPFRCGTVNNGTVFTFPLAPGDVIRCISMHSIDVDVNVLEAVAWEAWWHNRPILSTDTTGVITGIPAFIPAEAGSRMVFAHRSTLQLPVFLYPPPGHSYFSLLLIRVGGGGGSAVSVTIALDVRPGDRSDPEGDHVK